MSTATDKDTVETELPLKLDNDGDVEAPPAYSAEPPPKYEFVKKLKDVRENSDGYIHFLCSICTFVFCGTVCCALFIFLMLALPVAMIVIGAIHHHNCPMERFIPIYLIVGGVFGVVKALLNMGTLIHKRRTGKEEEDSGKLRSPNPVNACLNCFLLAWFIAGCVWVYSAKASVQFTDPTATATYCNRTAYLFSFWSLTVQLALLALCLCCGCLIVCFTCIFRPK